MHLNSHDPKRTTASSRGTSLLYPLAAALLLAPLSSIFAQPAWETADDLAPAAGRDIVANNADKCINLAQLVAVRIIGAPAAGHNHVK